MGITYKYWEKDAGFEEIQAKVYNENNPDNTNPATAKDIVERFARENIDPKTVRYAFTGDDKPLAYIQARDYPEVKETHLGYPWALPDCPETVQHKLFDEMLAYLQTRDSELAIRFNIPISNENIVKFVSTKEDKLEKVGKSYRRELDVHKIKKQSATVKEYNIRKATKNDVDILVELVKTDGRYAGQFSADEEIVKYFSERVLPDDHCYLAFKEEKLVMASAPLITQLPGDSEERLILRFHSFLPNHESALEPLLIDIAKECVSASLDTKPLSFFEGVSDSEIVKNIIKKFEPVNSEVQGISYGVKT
ncbi:MAG: hypothetical protein ACXAB2_13760 [Candidatus Hodarchaeales archaeon]